MCIRDRPEISCTPRRSGGIFRKLPERACRAGLRSHPIRPATIYMRRHRPSGRIRRYRLAGQVETWLPWRTHSCVPCRDSSRHAGQHDSGGHRDESKSRCCTHERESALRAVSSATNRNSTQTGKITAKQFRISSLAGGCRRVVSGKCVRHSCSGGFITFGGPEGHDDRLKACGGLLANPPAACR